MNHDQCRKWLQLLMYDELTPEEHSALDQHLGQCAECRLELEGLKRFHATLLNAGATVPSERMLHDARQKLREAIRMEQQRPSLWGRFSDVAGEYILSYYKIALGGAGALAAGILIGRMTLSPVEPRGSVHLPVTEQVAAFPDGDTRITNVRFLNADAGGDQIEFTFDAVSPVHMKGNINDERVQRVLAHSLINDQNPGVRLRSVSAFSTQIQKLKLPDREVKAALILALKADDNPGVRMEALKTLQGFQFDDEIKQAFLFVLMRDKNPALRIAAINSLDSARVSGQPTDKGLLEVLKQRMHSDDNNYVRIRAKAVLEEEKQQ